jgi:hypothetical protein
LKIPPKKKIFKYLIEAFAERFIGFIVGIWASGIISLFFETRGLNNLWGLTAHKTILRKATYEELEWWVSAIVGFMVYEMVNQFIRKKFSGYIRQFEEDHHIDGKDLDVPGGK